LTNSQIRFQDELYERQIKGAAAAQNPYVVENNKFTAGKTNGNVRKTGAESGTDSSSYGARQGRSNF